MLRRLAISLLLVILLAVVGLGRGLDELYGYLAQNENEVASTRETELLLQLGLALANTLQDFPQRDEWLQSWRRTNGVELMLVPTDAFPLPAPLLRDFHNGNPLLLNSDNGISLHYYLPGTEQVMSLSFPPAATAGQENPLNLILTLLFYAGVMSIVLIWLYPLIRRLLALRQAAMRFGEGHLDSRVAVSGLSFIGDIETEFNRMASRIQTLVSDNKLLSRAVSHDLRTPLSRLRFGLDTLLETADADQLRKRIEHLSSDLDEMESLVGALLHYARMDEARIRLHRVPLALTKLAHAAADDYREENKNIAIDPSATDAVINGDERYIKMLLANLLDNASKYARTRILLCVRQSGPRILLTVEDDGPGIAPERRDDVFKPFVRGEAAGERKGHGLGLAIVLRIAAWHHAGVHIDTSPDLQGARFTIDFPQAPAA